jgi:hypothetical protein
MGKIRTFSIDKKISDSFDAVAYEMNLNKSSLIEKLIKEFVEKKNTEKQEKFKQEESKWDPMEWRIVEMIYEDRTEYHPQYKRPSYMNYRNVFECEESDDHFQGYFSKNFIKPLQELGYYKNVKSRFINLSEKSVINDKNEWDSFNNLHGVPTKEEAEKIIKHLKMYEKPRMVKEVIHEM